MGVGSHQIFPQCKRRAVRMLGHERSNGRRAIGLVGADQLESVRPRGLRHKDPQDQPKNSAHLKHQSGGVTIFVSSPASMCKNLRPEFNLM